ncbi:MAG: sulfatase-like hydrolase/transferase [Thermoplasmata archaeon]|nr:sulfatase-like hydrolase/transferase [Thermoplasmata archaeon]
MTGRTTPNVVIVVLDCVRASDFPDGRAPVEDTPFLRTLQREMVTYSRAVAPSAWTIPSHASLFSGLYPWEHGMHLKGNLHFDASLPTLGTMLEREGYASYSLSANGFISPEFGLTNGFQQAAWGAWWERFARVFSSWDHPPCTWSEAAPSATTDSRPNDPSGLPPAFQLVSRVVHPFVQDRDPFWMPLAINTLNRTVSGVIRPSEPYSLHLSPWIESTFSGWLARQPGSSPVFGFLNFLDAHEPYFTDPRRVTGPLEWWRYAALRMDKTRALAGTWRPSAREYRMIHRLYRDMIAQLDRRVARVVRSLKESGRWDDTLFILTSDHGQAFGEHDFLFHGYRVWEPVLRVPLWVHYPAGADAGMRVNEWASLVDVAPTVMEAIGQSVNGFPSSYPLTALHRAPRPAPVVGIADGVHVRQVLESLCGPERVRFWDGPMVATYHGDRKVIRDVWADRDSQFDLAEDPDELHDLGAQAGGEELRAVALEAGRRLVAQPAPTQSPDVENRLRSWGYC